MLTILSTAPGDLRMIPLERNKSQLQYLFLRGRLSHSYFYLNKERKKNYIQKSVFNQIIRSCVKVEVAILGSLSLIVLMVSVDVKQQ